jgi:hypothetical protein
LIARRVEGEPDARSRITKVYRLLFGRDPVAAELEAGVRYVTEEPMRAYEERRAAEAAKKLEEAKKAEGKKPDSKRDAAAMPSREPVPATKPEAAPADGMMAGVMGAGAAAKEADEAKKLLPVTAFGRYVKVLLSSNEFLFIN